MTARPDTMIARTRCLAYLIASLVLAGLALLVWSDPAAAQFTPDDPGDGPWEVETGSLISPGRIDAIDTDFQNAAKAVGDDLKEIAERLLYSLLLIEMVWSLGLIVMRGGNIGRLLSALFRRIVIAGFFLFLIDGIPMADGTVGIATFITRVAEGLGNATIESSIKPSEVFGNIYDAGAQIYYATSGIGRKLSAGLVWLVLMFLGGIIAGLMLLAYIQIYIVFTIGIVTLAFGAWRQTEGIARNFLFSALGKSFKLFALLLIVAVIRLQLQNMARIESFEDGLLMIGLLVIFVMVLISVPGQVEAMVSSPPGPSADGTVVEAATYAPKQAARSTVNTGVSAVGAGVKTVAGAGWKAGKIAAGRRLAAGLRTIQAGVGP